MTGRDLKYFSILCGKGCKTGSTVMRGSVVPQTLTCLVALPTVTFKAFANPATQMGISFNEKAYLESEMDMRHSN